MKLPKLSHGSAIHYCSRRPRRMVVLSRTGIEHDNIVLEQLQEGLNIALQIEERERPRRLMNIGTHCAATGAHTDPFQLCGGPVFRLKHTSCLEQTNIFTAAVEVVSQHV